MRARSVTVSAQEAVPRAHEPTAPREVNWHEVPAKRHQPGRRCNEEEEELASRALGLAVRPQGCQTSGDTNFPHALTVRCDTRGEAVPMDMDELLKFCSVPQRSASPSVPPPSVPPPSVAPPSVSPASDPPPSAAPPSAAPPSDPPPSVPPPSDPPPSVAPPSVRPSSVPPPSVAPPSVAPPSVTPSVRPQRKAAAASASANPTPRAASPLLRPITHEHINAGQPARAIAAEQQGGAAERTGPPASAADGASASDPPPPRAVRPDWSALPSEFDAQPTGAGTPEHIQFTAASMKAGFTVKFILVSHGPHAKHEPASALYTAFKADSARARAWACRAMREAAGCDAELRQGAWVVPLVGHAATEASVDDRVTTLAESVASGCGGQLELALQHKATTEKISSIQGAGRVERRREAVADTYTLLRLPPVGTALVFVDDCVTSGASLGEASVRAVAAAMKAAGRTDVLEVHRVALAASSALHALSPPASVSSRTLLGDGGVARLLVILNEIDVLEHGETPIASAGLLMGYVYELLEDYYGSSQRGDYVTTETIKWLVGERIVKGHLALIAKGAHYNEGITAAASNAPSLEMEKVTKLVAILLNRDGECALSLKRRVFAREQVELDRDPPLNKEKVCGMTGYSWAAYHESYAKRQAAPGELQQQIKGLEEQLTSVEMQKELATKLERLRSEWMEATEVAAAARRARGGDHGVHGAALEVTAARKAADDAAGAPTPERQEAARRLDDAQKDLEKREGLRAKCHGRVGNHSSRGHGHTHITTYHNGVAGGTAVARVAPAASDAPDAPAASDASDAPALDPNRFIWGCCRQGTHASDPLCSCVSVEHGTGIEQVRANARATSKVGLGTRLSQREACKRQRPTDTPKTRFVVGQFETKEEVLAMLASGVGAAAPAAALATAPAATPATAAPRWTPEEDERLKKLVEEKGGAPMSGRAWREIAASLEHGRGAEAVRKHYERSKEAAERAAEKAEERAAKKAKKAEERAAKAERESAKKA